MIKDNPILSRYSLSRQVCEWLGWRRPNGELKDMSCRVALLTLQKKGVIDLPAKRKEPIKKREELHSVILEKTPVFTTLAELGEVSIIPTDSRDRDKFRIWTELMSHHYLGSGPLCGAQIRYLIRSEKHGWLGGLSFSAPAWRVSARDKWIGWDDEIRKRQLPKVVCNSRFLILPWVDVPNLASHVLSLSVRRLPEDWRNRYAEEPVLIETYVECEKFIGTCYKAANWIYVGKTAGRGRQDRANKKEVPIKDVYLYQLVKDVRERLCGGVTLMQEEAVGPPADWAEEEFGNAAFGDERLTKRLLTIARDLWAKPQANLPQACGNMAKAKAAYRFFKNEEVRMDKILKPHYESTYKRMQGEKIVLAIQDTTTLNYSSHPAMEGTGFIGSSKDGGIGLVVHDTLAMNTEGTPLGLIDVQCWARDEEEYGKRHKRHELPIEEKESFKWLKSFNAAGMAKKECPETLVISVGDREADIYELFELAQQDPNGAKVLVRAMRDRVLAEEQKHLLEKMQTEQLAGKCELQVPRKGIIPTRTACMEVRFSEVTLKPPKRKTNLPNVKIWAVLTEERETPEGIVPLKWLLLTTVETTTFEEAMERVKWYSLRWGIEIYHRTLKSGCKIEDRQLGTADRIETCLAIDMVVAWRVFHLTKLGRETPDVPCTVFFEEAEWKALVTFVTRNAALPSKVPSLKECTRMIGSLGGHLGRKGDGEPGTEAMWLGLQRLDDISAMWKVMVVNSPQPPPIVSRNNYG